MRRLFAVLSLVAACTAVPPPEAAGTRVVPEPVPSRAPVVRVYIAPRVSPPDIDGRLDDPAWSAVPWTEPFTDIEGDRRPRPRHDTRVRVAWDDSTLYLAARLEEPDLWATLTTRDTVLFYDNDFEVFLDPDGDTHRYAELEINALGTVWDLLLERPYRDGGPAVTAWDIAGLRSAVHLDGTLNDARDRDRGWSVEIAIPLAALGRSRPVEGEQWRVNFSRVQWDLERQGDGYRKQPRPEHNWVWSPQGLVNMHLPELWGVVQFGGAPRPLDDAEALWALRRVYYAQRAHRARTGRYAAYLDSLGLVDLNPPVRLWLEGSGYRAVTLGLGALTVAPDGRIDRPAP
jgi:hypothetical protein